MWQMVHELMHAVGLAINVPEDLPDDWEPYFELEPVSELGQSFESAVRSDRSNVSLSDGD